RLMSATGMTLAAPSGAASAGGPAVMGAGSVAVGFASAAGVGFGSGGGFACVAAGLDDREVVVGAPTPRRGGSASSIVSGLVASVVGEDVVGSVDAAADESGLACVVEETSADVGWPTGVPKLRATTAIPKKTVATVATARTMRTVLGACFIIGTSLAVLRYPSAPDANT